MKIRNKKNERPTLQLIDEAFQALREAPAGVLTAYYIGSVPFMAGFLFFWSDMSRSAFAAEHCGLASLAMALLFLWMKCWQSVSSSLLRTSLAGVSSPWTGRRVLKLVVTQTVIQPAGLIAIPIALLLMLPFYAAYAFFQNVTLFGDGDSDDLAETTARSWRQALLWPYQNHIVIWLLSPWVLATGMLTAFGVTYIVLALVPGLQEFDSPVWFFIALAFMFNVILPLAPFACIVAGNIAILLAIVPTLLQSLFGIESLFTLSGWHGILNTTFLMSVYGTAYLCLDPLVKAAYVLRCFHGESLQTGEDLRIELRQTAEKRREVAS